MSTDSFEGYNVARLRDELANEKLPALRDAGLLSADNIQYLESFRESFEPGEHAHYSEDRPAALYHNADKYVRITRRDLGENLRKAVQNGNFGVIEHAMGLAESDSGTPFQELLTLEELVHGDDFKIFVFTGGQGGGKSYFAYTLAKFKMRLCERDNTTARVVTNSLSAVELNDEMEFVGSPRELLDYRLENPGHIVFVLDEASSFFGSKAGQGADLVKFVPFLRRLRKMRILPIIVSHRAMDIGTDIRKLESVVFVHKPDRETAVFYGDNDGDDLDNKLIEITGYSTDTRYDYESEDLFISWKWDGLEEIVELMENPQEFRELWETKGVVKDLKGVTEEIAAVSELEEQRDELIREVAELEYSQSEIAEYAGVSPSRVSRLLADDNDSDSSGDDGEDEGGDGGLSELQRELLADALSDNLDSI